MNEQKQVQRFDAALLMSAPELDGEMRQWWIDNPSELQVSLRCLSKKPSSKFDVWKTIKLGTSGLKTTDDFRKAIKDGGIKIGDYANDILGKPAFTVAIEETELDLVVVSVAELGFKNEATCKQIYARAKERGLDLCPDEVSPQLRLQYKNQPKGEWLIVAMEPIRASAGDPHVFVVGHDDGGLWLGSGYGHSGSVWSADSRWVFVRPRKYQK